MKRRTTETLNQMVANWTVLIVDDTPDNLIVAKTALKFHGAQVHTATNGEEGLEVLKTLRPTVILLDIRMPQMNGWAMFKSIREMPEIAHIPVIAITAFAMDSDEDKLLKAGFDGYISKPFDMFTFVNEVVRFVTQATQKQQKSEDTSA
ncbi:MAG: response regulator [Anaerolineae bacterium]|nr:response regulator [Anaerolineae bacterium]